jgi:hypothetical protein
MNTRHQLDNYLDDARRRLQWIIASQGAALLFAALLLLTLLAAVSLGRFGFNDSAVLVARLLLLAAVGGVVAWYVLRTRALRRDGGAAQLERALPGQGGRVTTYLQESAKQDKASILLDLLAGDAQRVADQEPVAEVIPARRLWVPAGAALACVVALFVVLQVGGLLGESAQRLWLGRVPATTTIAEAAGGIAVQPGDTTVRRNQDLGIGALVARGGSEVQVHVKFDSSGEWEIAPMEADAKGGYAFTLFAVREPARYYVSSGSLKSKEHRIDVVDLPKIESLRLTYDYPSWTGLKRRLEESGGDISAVSGTKVSVEVTTDKPLTGPLLVINGSDSDLSQSGATSRGAIAVKEAGHYRIATRFGNEIVPLTPDYVIDVVADQKPSVEIVKPGKDYRATSVEEVPVNVRARDDFRLEALELHYSVNGGEWRQDKLPAGSADIQAAALLRLEELQQRGPRGEAPLLEPGDLVSYYALARDHGSSAQTDLFLIQIQPFDRRYTQSQAQAGGGGGGGGGEDEDGQISQRQREVLLATWNLQRASEAAGGREAERDADNARMLSEVQQTLANQVNTLVERAKARMLTSQDESVANFVKSMQEAAKEMLPAAKNLSDQELKDAITHEQKALQQLLRAEATMRDIQVAQQSQRGGGGGGGGGQAGRDLQEMTELELDLEKNQYETEPQQGGGSPQQQAQAENDTLRRLKELARRQEQLAREQQRQNMPAEQQKWQQEQLRREAEQLRQQLEQLAQQRSQQQGGQQQQSGSQQQQGSRSGQQQGGTPSGSQPGSQQSGSQGGGRQQQASAAQQSAAEAARQVAEAMEQMRQAQARGDQQAAARASEQLNRAREQLERGQQQADQQQFANLAESARDLAERQRQSERDLRAAIGNRAPNGIANPQTADRGMSFEQMEKLSSAKRDLQNDLESLRGQIDRARRQAQQQAPRASQKLAEASKDLEDSGITGSLSRSARDIERGRGVEAATREGFIGEALQRLQQQLGEAASTASNESGRGSQKGREADAGDLLAELGELRRQLDRARQDIAQNQNQRGGGQPGQGQPGAQSQSASEGQGGQAGGQQGQQGEGGQGQGGQNGGSQQAGQAGQGGANGNDDGGVGGAGNFGGGADRLGGRGLRAGGPIRFGNEAIRPLTEAERQAIRSQGQLSGTRLQQLREQLQDGALGETDIRALQDLAQRLKRGVDPMAADYQQMVSLVNQLELAALKAQQAKSDERPTRSADSVDDSRRYRDNVAEYYRRLGAPND